jgi:hypothetical protein
MSSVGHRPTLEDIIAILTACEVTEATVPTNGGNWVEFRIVFNRSNLTQEVEGWSDGLPKPRWLLEEILGQLKEWYQQKCREQQWVSKEGDVTSIDGLIVYYAAEMQKARKVTPQTTMSRINASTCAHTVLRLKELKERREAAGMYSQNESKREKARKAWADDEYEAPKREKEQQWQYGNKNYYQDAFGGGTYSSYAGYGESAGFTFNEEILRRARERIDKAFEDAMYGRGPFSQGYARTPPPPNTQGKKPWHETLGVSIRATKKDIQKAYRVLASKYHPDRYKGTDAVVRMSEINVARDEGLAGL